ncbi:MAG: TIGR03617 family F420-dependent LLM class oxidoreductase [Acidimicrobiales bacterium]
MFLPLAEAAAALAPRWPPAAGPGPVHQRRRCLPRSPMHLAIAAWDLHRVTGGRFLLGLGTQVRVHVEHRYGAVWGRPVAHLRDLVDAVHAVFASFQTGAPLAVHNEHYHLDYLPPLFNPGPLPWGPPPVWCGAFGPAMTRMVAGTADGLLVHPFHTERSLHELTLANVTAGLTAAGRDRADLGIGVSTLVCAGRDERELAVAEQGCRWLLAFYGSTPAYRPVLELEGAGELQPELHRLAREGRWEDMAASIDDDLLDRLCVRGAPAEVGAELTRRYGPVADRVGLTLPYDAPDDLLTEVVAATPR